MPEPVQVVVKLKTTGMVREATELMSRHGWRIRDLQSAMKGSLRTVLSKSEVRRILQNPSVRSIRPLFVPGKDSHLKVTARQERDTAFQAESLRRSMEQPIGGSNGKAAGFCILQVPTKRTAVKLAAALQADPLVDYSHVVTDRQIQVAGIDPRQSQQWALGATRWHGAHVRKVIEPKERGISIAVIDTGIAVSNGRMSHPDLKGRVTRVDFANPRADKKTFGRDETGHGTHIAGIIGAGIKNSLGICGFCMPKRLFALKATVQNAFKTEAYYNALEYAIRQGIDPVYESARGRVRVLNLSLAGATIDPTEESLIKEAIRNNIVVVAAMGNFNSNKPLFPAALKGVIAVGAVDNANRRWVDSWSGYGSNTGSHISLCAPGDGILSTVPRYPRGGRHDPEGYSNETGTSMAAAFVSAAAALLMAERPKATVQQIKSTLEKTARKIGPATKSPEFGHGMLNIEAALKEIRKLPK